MNRVLEGHLKLVAAEHALQFADETRIVRLANEILCDGTFTPSLGDLSFMHDCGMDAVAPVFHAALTELKVPLPTRDEPRQTIVTENALKIINDPARAYDYITSIRAVSYWEEDEEDHLETKEWVSLFWRFDPTEDLFAEGGRLVESPAERQEMLEKEATLEAQVWLAKHGRNP
jgi:hypothetical protein